MICNNRGELNCKNGKGWPVSKMKFFSPAGSPFALQHPMLGEFSRFDAGESRMIVDYPANHAHHLRRRETILSRDRQTERQLGREIDRHQVFIHHSFHLESV